jgi:nucleoside-diphosphate-sugar epimerase
MNILITGATGFVGRCLVMQLMESHSVTLAVRGQAHGMQHTATKVVGDIGRHTDWRAALERMDCVIHLAARVHIMSSAQDAAPYYETNTEGTAQLARSAAIAGVRRFIFLSTVKVNGERTEGAPFSASDSPCPVDHYGKSKLQAEQRLYEVAAYSPMTVTTIRPPLVYGPGVRANFLRLMNAVCRGWPLPLGSVCNARSLVSVWNLCDLIRTAIEVPFSGTIMVSDGDDLSTPELIRRISKSMRRPVRLLPAPVPVLKAFGRCLGRGDAISRLCDSLAVDISETRRALGWSPPVSVDESLDRTVKWFLRERPIHAV